MSELIEPASLLIDEAENLAAEKKTGEAVAKYRAALAELDRIERENPERVKKPEFATLRTKRAYVNAAIDTLLLGQVKAHAQPVAVSDTAELEKILADEKKAAKEPEKTVAKDTEKKVEEKTEKKVVQSQKAVGTNVESAKPPSTRERAIAHVAKGEYEAAEALIDEMLKAKPKSATALNLRAAVKMRQGKLKDAEDALDQAITSNPHSYHAYYNMAWLMLKKGPDNKAPAKLYYETGRAMGGGPKNEALEAACK